MSKIIVGGLYGVYKVLRKASKKTSKGMARYECSCQVCGGERTFSASYLITNAVSKCLCDKQQNVAEVKREYDYLMRHYGELNLCCSCKHMFKCPVMKNIIDKRFMKKYYIDQAKGYNKRINIIIVLDCEKFEFDWGNKGARIST